MWVGSHSTTPHTASHHRSGLWWLAVALVLLSACRHDGRGGRAIVSYATFTLTGDTLIEGGVTVTAATDRHIETTLTRDRLDSLAAAYCHHRGAPGPPPTLVGGRPWRAAEQVPDLPTYRSRQRLFNAVHRMNCDHLTQAKTPAGTYNTGDPTELTATIWLALAWLDPAGAQKALMGMVGDDGTVKRPGGWPLCHSGRLMWAAAAWEVYCATGDRQWLATLHNVVQATLDQETALLADPATGLLHGLAGAGTPTFYPEWASPTDLAQTLPLMAVAMAKATLDVLAAADEELDMEHDHGTAAARLKDAANQHLWSERKGVYSAYLYGPATLMRAPRSDIAAQAVAMLCDMADDGRSASLLNAIAVDPRGVTMTHPDTATVEPYFTHRLWPAVQALWTIAAARQGHEAMVRHGLAALLRAQALFQSRHITLAGKPRNDLLTAAAGMAMTLRVLAGMQFTPQGIEFAPAVPACLPGDKLLQGFNYRDATLDITLRGTGSDIASLTIDGKVADGQFVPATLTGHHTVVITLKPGHTSGTVALAAGTAAIPPTPLVTWTPDSGRITNYTPGATYRLVVNGDIADAVSDSTFAVPTPPGGATMFSVTATGKAWQGFMARPIVVAGSDSYTITVSTPHDGDTLAFDLPTARSGAHLLQLDYHSRGSGCDALLVSANGHPQGALLLPGCDSVAISPTLPIALLRGNNRLLLTRPPAVAHTATPITIRVIKR